MSLMRLPAASRVDADVCPSPSDHPSQGPDFLLATLAALGQGLGAGYHRLDSQRELEAGMQPAGATRAPPKRKGGPGSEPAADLATS